MMEARITGSGIISSLGRGKTANTTAMKALCTGLRPPREVRDFLDSKTPLNDVPDSFLDDCGVDDRNRRNDRMACAALQEALDEAGVDRGSGKAKSSALIVGCYSGDSWEAEIWCRRNAAPGEALEGHEPGSGRVSLRLARWLGSEGPVMTIATACTSSANALVTALQMLELNRVDRAIVVGVHSITHTEVCGFESLMLLDPDGCHPFDLHRKGLQLGEGAAALILERAGDENGPGPRIAGWASTCDPHHLTTSSPDGSGGAAAMAAACAKAAVSPAAVRGLKAHGTGTPNNDLAEGQAIRRLFGDRMPPVTSIKRYFGHTMAASGLLELTAFLSCVRAGFFPASLGTDSPDPETGICPIPEHLPAEKEPQLLNSFGFGGSCVSFVVRG